MCCINSDCECKSKGKLFFSFLRLVFNSDSIRHTLDRVSANESQRKKDTERESKRANE